jgi:xanthine dehydrogenase accessory factor
MPNADVLSTAQRLQAAQQPFALVSVLRVQAPASAQSGDKAVVTADGIVSGWIGGGCAQPAVMKTVRQALVDGRARLMRISPAEEGQVRELGDVLEFGMACHSGGTLELFVDPVLPVATLVVIGETPLAQALATLAPHVGWQTQTVADETAANIPPGAFIVVATQGRRDLQGLRAALRAQPRQIFLVASARKGAVLKDALKAAGEEAAAVDAIVAPAGQPIGAQTPPEIALSVLAAVVAARRAGTACAALASASPGTPSQAGSESAGGPPELLAPPADEPSADLQGVAPKGRLNAWLERLPLPQLPSGKGGCCS